MHLMGEDSLHYLYACAGRGSLRTASTGAKIAQQVTHSDQSDSGVGLSQGIRDAENNIFSDG
jgi:hypothetical protein